ncbi:MAG: hypothetical protein HOI42_13905 [Candidatus Marinimicrobia bacterium]|jgi:hypothetical protein|nr:hypothetical protein [Candidatus Neomarinimicrobiota bacterium]
MTYSAFDLLDEKYSLQPQLEVIEDPAPDDPGLADPAPGDQDPALSTLDHPDQSKKPQPPLTDWQDSLPVQLLSSYLKEFYDQGIHLKQTSDGQPVLCFKPGLKLEEKDPERFSIALHAAYLMDNARADLQELIDNDALHLQIDKGIWL